MDQGSPGVVAEWGRAGGRQDPRQRIWDSSFLPQTSGIPTNGLKRIIKLILQAKKNNVSYFLYYFSIFCRNIINDKTKNLV